MVMFELDDVFFTVFSPFSYMKGKLILIIDLNVWLRGLSDTLLFPITKYCFVKVVTILKITELKLLRFIHSHLAELMMMLTSQHCLLCSSFKTRSLYLNMVLT